MALNILAQVNVKINSCVDDSWIKISFVASYLRRNKALKWVLDIKPTFTSQTNKLERTIRIMIHFVTH